MRIERRKKNGGVEGRMKTPVIEGKGGVCTEPLIKFPNSSSTRVKKTRHRLAGPFMPFGD